MNHSIEKQIFSFLLKSFRDDLEYTARLLKSFHLYNRENIKLYLVVPRADQEFFLIFKTLNVELLFDEMFGDELVHEPVNGTRTGYINQQIIKIMFGKLNLTENWMCLDSDGEFLRSFRISDFMFDDDTPYSVLVEDNELRLDELYFRSIFPERMRKIEKIARTFDYAAKPILTCHGFQIISQKVIRDLEVNFMNKNGYRFRDLLSISPYEFSWYNIWLQKTKIIDLHIREPYFKCFHHQGQHRAYVDQGITKEHISNGYLGLVINSNYSRDFGVVEYDQIEKYEVPLRVLIKDTKLIFVSWISISRKLFNQKFWKRTTSNLTQYVRNKIS
jgi:hypothetical protein